MSSVWESLVERQNLAPTQASAVQILTLLMLSFSVISVVAQFVTKLAIARRFGAADAVLALALIVSAGQCATVLSPPGRVIGNDPGTISEDAASTALKAIYSGDILMLITLVLTKSSLIIALFAITPVVEHRIAISATSTIVATWGVSTVFASSFQCPAPKRWDVSNPDCIDIRAMRTYSAVLNILTDVLLVVLPSVIVLPMQMSWGKRLAVLSGFWVRVLTVSSAAIQIYFIQQLSYDRDFVTNVWKTTICNEITQTMSVMTVAIPFLKPFLMSLESGYLRADDLSRRTEAGMYGSGDGESEWTSRYIKLQNRPKLNHLSSASSQQG